VGAIADDQGQVNESNEGNNSGLAIVAIDVEHLYFDDEGRVRVTVPRSKTDQTGEGQTVWILPGGSHCPVKALREWLQFASVTAGAVFRSIDRHRNIGPRISAGFGAVRREAIRAGGRARSGAVRRA
jgi:hypothetical protein